MEADLDGLIGIGRPEPSGGCSTWLVTQPRHPLSALNLNTQSLPSFRLPEAPYDSGEGTGWRQTLIAGVSNRRVDELVQGVEMSCISKSSVSKPCEDIDERVNALAGEWPFLVGRHLPHGARRRANGQRRCHNRRGGQTSMANSHARLLHAS